MIPKKNLLKLNIRFNFYTKIQLLSENGDVIYIKIQMAIASIVQK